MQSATQLIREPTTGPAPARRPFHWTLPAAVILLCGMWATAVWTAGQVQADPPVRQVALNGVHAGAIHRQLSAHAGHRPPRRLLVRSTAAALVSQAGWWGATVIGFLSSQG